MAATLALLHTAPGHVATFDALLQQQAPGLAVQHAVDEALLADAQRLGTEDPALRQRVHAAMQALARTSGAALVVCTCSTIGGIAEATPAAGFEAARIDRAMAERAITLGPRVLMVAALQSTLAPTAALLEDAAARADAPLTLQPLLLDQAWPLFQRGEREAYFAAVADAVRARAAQADVVVLAQASMAGAVPLLAGLGIEVLASPALGVAAALARLGRD